jgi:hypothetical protein
MKIRNNGYTTSTSYIGWGINMWVVVINIELKRKALCKVNNGRIGESLGLKVIY